MQYVKPNKANEAWSYLLFLIWPLLALLVSVRRLGYKYSRNVVIFFFGLFGFTYLYDDESDSSRHAVGFLKTASRPFSEFLEIVSGLYSAEGAKPDFIMALIDFILSRFTTDTSIYFTVLALILAWMLMKNIDTMYNVYQRKKTEMGFIFIIFLFILMPPSRILSFRHYLALLVFIFGLYKYYTEKKIIYLFLLTSSIFIHFGFLMVIGLYYGFKLSGRQNKIFYVLIALSFIFYDQAATFLKTYGAGLGGLESTVEGYTHKKYLARVSEYQDQRNVIINSYPRWTTFFMILSLIYHKIKFKKFDIASEYIYSFLLLLFAFINFMQGLESIANRFSVVFQAITCLFYVHLYSTNNLRTSAIFKYASLMFLILNGVVLFRITIQYANVLLLSPLMTTSFIVDSQDTILNLIK